MTRFVIRCLPAAWILLGAASAWAGGKDIAIANAAQLDPAVAERVRAFAQQQLEVPVRLFTAASLAFTNLEDCASQVLALKDPGDVLVIALVSPATNTAVHSAIFSKRRVAVINAAALQTGDMEKYARRLERMVMRGVAFLSGLEPSPDPFCVTRNYVSLADLDTMGRNFGPPWQMRFRAFAAKEGLPALSAGLARHPRGKPAATNAVPPAAAK